MFPTPAVTRWGQFKHGDELIVADFVVNVEKPLMPRWLVNFLLNGLERIQQLRRDIGGASDAANSSEQLPFAFSNKSKKLFASTYSTCRNSVCSRPSGPMKRIVGTPQMPIVLADLFDFGRVFLGEVGPHHRDLVGLVNHALIAKRRALHLAARSAPVRGEIDHDWPMCRCRLLEICCSIGLQTIPPVVDPAAFNQAGW